MIVTKDYHLTTHKGERRDVKQMTAHNYSEGLTSSIAGLLFLTVGLIIAKWGLSKAEEEGEDDFSFFCWVVGLIMSALGLVLFLSGGFQVLHQMLFVYFLEA